MSDEQKDHEIEACVPKCFDDKEAVVVPAKSKRKYTKKVKIDPIVVETVKPAVVNEEPKQLWCSTCQEHIADNQLMRIGAGENRWALFCPMCQRSFGFQDPVVTATVARLIRDNPTGK